MSGDRNSAILVVCDEVYVKGAGDFLSSATVEEKWNTSYVVRFADNSRRLVDASDLMWLGYCGRLPGQMWPHRIDVQLTRRGEHRVLQQNNIRFINGPRTVPEYLQLRYQEALDRERIPNRGFVNRKQTIHMMPPVTSQQYPQNTINNRPIQSRCSVLRFNHKLLEKEKYHEALEKHSSFNHEIEASQDLQKLTNFYDHEKELKERFSYHQIQSRLQHDVDIHKNNRVSNLKDKFSPDVSNDSLSNDQHIRPLNVVTPPFVGDKFYDKLSPWSDETPFQTNLASRYKERMRKKESVKKCRKIFGVKNRQAWCMQCRWKKACSRFKRDTRQHLSPE